MGQFIIKKSNQMNPPIHNQLYIIDSLFIMLYISII